MLNVLTGIALSLSFSPDVTKVPQVAELEELARKQRLAITKGIVKVEYTTSSPNSNDKPTLQTKRSFWFDKEHFRCDVIRGRTHNSPSRSISCRNCEKPGHFISYTRLEKDKETTKSVLNLQKTQSPPHGFYALIDPRLFGTVPTTIDRLNDKTLQTILGRPNRSDPTVRRDTWKGHECWLIQFTSYDVLFRVWICPKMDHSVIHVTSESRFEGKTTTNSVESELEQYGPSKIWFPKTMTYKRFEGEAVVEQQSATIVEASLNEPVPAEVFTLAGMDLEDNTPVSGPDGLGVALLWDGTSLVPFSRPEILPQPILDNDGQRSGWLRILAYALAAVAVAAISFVVYRRRIAHGT